MMVVRPPAVAGTFYPAAAHQLRNVVEQFLQAAQSSGPIPKAIIAPHAGYLYSGPVAASAYASVATARDTIRQVILLGPAHRIPFSGLAASSAEAFSTPLGSVAIDHHALSRVLAFPQVRTLDQIHTREHSLEVHLPFLQEVLADFTLVPLLVGHTTPAAVGEVLDTLWDGAATLIVVSSDLSHYHDYDTARRLDELTSRAIESLRWEEIENEQACGRYPIQGLLLAARRHGLQVRTVDLRNSGDTAGPRDEVVGYGAYVFARENR
jgi:MEMO1 family protein